MVTLVSVILIIILIAIVSTKAFIEAFVWQGGVVVRLSDSQSRQRDNSGSNPLAAFSKLGEFHSQHVVSIHSAV